MRLTCNLPWEVNRRLCASSLTMTGGKALQPGLCVFVRQFSRLKGLKFRVLKFLPLRVIFWRFLNDGTQKKDGLERSPFQLVAEEGLEPPASGLWARRATNCSTPQCKGKDFFWINKFFALFCPRKSNSNLTQLIFFKLRLLSLQYSICLRAPVCTVQGNSPRQ